jgi:ribosomal protein S12 methylthiotransferase
MISGHPGETDDDFLEMMTFIGKSRFERLGIFNYSHEENTHSHSMKDDVPAEVKQQRSDAVMELQEGISLELNQARIGQTLKVIIDRKEGGSFIGRTEFDSPEVDNEITIDGSENYLRIGDFVNVKVTDATEFDLTGKVIS